MELIKPDFGVLFWFTIGLLVIILILRRFAWKPILQALEARERKIEEALKAADQAQKKIEQLKQEYEEMKLRMAEERNRMLEEARKLYEQKLEEAERRARERELEILNRARQEARRIYEETRARLIEESAAMAVKLAEKILRKELSYRDEAEKYVKEVLEELNYAQER